MIETAALDSTPQAGAAPAGAPATAAPAAGAPVAPVPAPTAPVVVTLGDEPKAPQVAGPSDTSDPFVYDPTGDAGLDYALGYVGKLGYGADHPAIVAAMGGEFTLLEAELAQRGDKALGYKEVIGLAKAAHERVASERRAKDAAIGQYAVAAAGSQERWAQVQAWASASATPTEKAEVNAALAAGGVQAKATLDYLVRMFEKSSGGTRDPAKAVSAAAGNSAGASSGPLTAEQYRAEVTALAVASAGRDPTGTPQYAALQARRVAAMRRGG